MKLKQVIISIALISISLSVFWSCDKIEEPYFKPVYTDRNVLMEFISDAQTFDAKLYSDFVKISSSQSLITPMVVLSGDTSIEGNSLAANNIVSRFNLKTSDSLSMINRSSVNSVYGVEKAQWENRLAMELEKKGEFNLEIDGSFNYASAKYSGVCSVSALNGCSEALNVSIYLLEDSVEVQSQNVMNVLRISEEKLIQFSQIKRGETIENAFSYDLSSFVELSNLKLLFVLENSNTSEILQSNTVFIQGLEFDKNQNILVEDFTGHKCGNCPKAHEELTLLRNTYGTKIVPMAIHFGYYAQTNSSYPTDFTTDVGDAIGNKFGVTSTPVGMVNRVGDEGNKLLEFSEWDASISKLLTKTPSVGIAMAAEIKDNKIEASVFVKAFEQNDTLLKVQVFIIENHIIDKQLYYGHDPEEIEDYEHEHVLRGSLNGDWGEDLTSVPFKKNNIVYKSYNYTINPDWNTQNLLLVAVVYNDVTKQICQVKELHLQ